MIFNAATSGNIVSMDFARALPEPVGSQIVHL
jgi:hypothetical protein